MSKSKEFLRDYVRWLKHDWPAVAVFLLFGAAMFMMGLSIGQAT
jgi:hypothetical protein